MQDRSQAEKFSQGYAYFVAGLLAVVYTFNFLDRQVMAILQEAIRKEIPFTDTQFGLLTGTTFALLYSTLPIPLAWFADRGNRVRIISVACAVWSVFTAACGLANNFVQFAVCRIGVAAGEAGGSPPSYSLISDYFPPHKRTLGMAIYSLGVPFGMLVGSAAAASIAQHFGWRTAFYAVGLPGLLMALIAWLVIREPQRGGLDPLKAGALEHASSDGLLSSIGAFFKNKTLLMTSLSSASSAWVGYAMLSWSPSFLQRVKHMTMSDVAIYYSLTIGISMAIGTFGSGWLVDRLARHNKRAYAIVPAVAFAITVPFYIGMVYAPTWQTSLMFLSVPFLLNNMYLAPAIAVVQNAAPPAQRTMSSALLLLVLNLVGLGVGPLYVGRISDYFKPMYGDDSLRYGILALVPIVVLTIFMHILASRTIERD